MTTRARLRQILIYAGYIIGFSLLQATWPDTLAIQGVRPDLALILVVMAGYLYGSMDGAVTGLLCGFMLDMQSGRILGFGMLLMMFAGLLPGLLFRRLFRKSAIFAAVGVLAAALLFHTAMYSLSYVFPTLRDLVRNRYDIERVIFGHILPSALVDAVITLPAAWLFRRFGPYRKTPEVSE